MEPHKFKSMVFLSSGVMFLITLKKALVHFSAFHGVTTKASVMSPFTDLDLSDNLLLLATNFALCGYMLSMDDHGHHSINTLSAYYKISCIFTALAAVAKVGGISLPFSTRLESPYCLFLAVVVTMIYLPVLLSPCESPPLISSFVSFAVQSFHIVTSQPTNIGNPETGDNVNATAGGTGLDAV